MGAFNVLKATSPTTGKPIRIQFKYGERWQHEYELGARIVFPAGVDLRETRVTLVGGSTESPMPSAESEHYEIRFEYGFATSIRPITEDEYERLEIGR
jgi:hypothetical protein